MAWREQWKKCLEQRRISGDVGKYPKALKLQVIGYAESQRRAGFRNAAMARELGIDASTLRWWLKRHAPKQNFFTGRLLPVQLDCTHPAIDVLVAESF
jgi:hypothetical protein